MAVRPVLNVLRLDGFPLLRQLNLEEALMRTDTRNFLIFSKHPQPRTVVVGVGSRVSNFVNREHCVSENVPIVKRFTGGGTVLLDHNSWLVSLLFNRADTPAVTIDPRAILRYTHDAIYKPVFSGLIRPSLNQSLEEFSIQHYDYCIGQRKVGGNAQYMTQRRWLHHTSFLWDFDPILMNRFLKMPPPEKRPEYRKDRPHQDFVVGMKNYLTTDLDGLTDCIIHHIQQNLFDVNELLAEDVMHVLNRDYYSSTRQIVSPEDD